MTGLDWFKLGLILLIFVALVVLGGAIYNALEDNINFRDSVYLMMATATTIGSPLYNPTNANSTWFMLFYSPLIVIYFIASFFVVFSMAFMQGRW